MNGSNLSSAIAHRLVVLATVLFLGSMGVGCHHRKVHHTYVDYRVAQPDDHRFDTGGEN